MSETGSRLPPPDQHQRERALDASRSVLVQAPAGSGKTDLLTRRFLRLLGEVDDPAHIVAITFTKAAAAEMRHRILSELEKASELPPDTDLSDEFSMTALARRALLRSRALGWQLLETPASLRISTIDSFCREIAIQQPLISGFGSDLHIAEQPDDLYRRAARRTLEQIDSASLQLQSAIESLLLLRDNNWHEMENLLVKMLSQRDRWMHDFLFERDPDWVALRQRLERPFAQANHEMLSRVCRHLQSETALCDEILALARFACEQTQGLHRELAELAELPSSPGDAAELEFNRATFLCLANFLLTKEGSFRRVVNAPHGFPPTHRSEKLRMAAVLAQSAAIDGLHHALLSLRQLPPMAYSDDEWSIIQSCFLLLRHAAAALRAVFAEAGVVDFVEVAQIAGQILSQDRGAPSDVALRIADDIHHLLVDEFQDTSRRQHNLISNIVAAWPDTTNRTLFVVGDPMQSIYFFRDADAELFPQVRKFGLAIAGEEPFKFDFVPLSANFRTDPGLVEDLNRAFQEIFSENDPSGIAFAPAVPARPRAAERSQRRQLHIQFVLKSSETPNSTITDPQPTANPNVASVVALAKEHLERALQAKQRGERYRIAILARKKKSLTALAEALHDAAIPCRALDLEPLKDRPEVLDVLSLARAFLNPFDRVAWLGVLRAPWAALGLADLHALTSNDTSAILDQPIPRLLEERASLASTSAQMALGRVLDAYHLAIRSISAAPGLRIGTWLQQVWLSLGGLACVDEQALTNLELLWSCLDALPNGAPDLVGPALTAALDKLTGRPDPTVDSENGIQLMTIHKSKGLEFEIVLVPDLHDSGNPPRSTMLSWLERGLPEPDDSGEVTEFLIAPIAPKGEDRGEAKAWVDRVIREREADEMKRILYVAATRAREELHFFAQAEYREVEGTFVLAEPKNSLFACAWPGYNTEIQGQFEQWKTSPHAPGAEGQLDQLAASAAANIVIMPSAGNPAILHRLPDDFKPEQSASSLNRLQPETASTFDEGALFTRHEGGIPSRALGNAVHELLEKIADLRASLDWDQTRMRLLQCRPRLISRIRASGLPITDSASIADQAISLATRATHDPHGQWILSPHDAAGSEASWTGIVDKSLRNVRVDRIFLAGPQPLSTSGNVWWIIDYKTTHGASSDPAAAVADLRQLFAPQLKAYATLLRNLQGADALIRAGLYYPRMDALDWWEL